MIHRDLFCVYIKFIGAFFPGVPTDGSFCVVEWKLPYKLRKDYFMCTLKNVKHFSGISSLLLQTKRKRIIFVANFFFLLKICYLNIPVLLFFFNF